MTGAGGAWMLAGWPRSWPSCLAAVVAYCLARSLVPSLQDPDHGRDLDALARRDERRDAGDAARHLARPVAVAALAVFVVGIGWAAVGVAAPGTTGGVRPARRGLGGDGRDAAPDRDRDRDGGDRRVGCAPPSRCRRPTWPRWSAPTALVVALLVGLGAILLIRLAGSVRTARRRSRAGWGPRARSRWRWRWAPCSWGCSDLIGHQINSSLRWPLTHPEGWDRVV